MQSSAKEMKAIARAVGASLAKQGHKVPHSNVLHAIASATNNRNWHVVSSAAAIEATPSALPVEHTKSLSEIFSGYSESTKFLVRLAYCYGTPLEVLPATDEEARKKAFEKLEPVESADSNSLLKWGGWNVPCKISLKTSVLDAGDFEPEEAVVGSLLLTTKKVQLRLEVAYRPDSAPSRWYLTRSGSASAYQQVEVAAAGMLDAMAQTPVEVETRSNFKNMPVDAKFWTDDRRFEVSFDAQAFFQSATDKQLLAVAEVGFSGDYATDAVAEFFSKSNEELQEAFGYLGVLPRKYDCGFECSVDSEGYYRWMAEHKSAVIAAYLCDRFEVAVTQNSSDEEVLRRWDWYSQDRAQGSETSFVTKEEAILDAFHSLRLLDEAIAA